MEYFLLQQDKEYINVPIMKDVMNKIDRRNICKEKSHNIDRITSLFVVPNKDMDYLDVLDRQLFIVSEKMKSLLAKYEPFIEFKTISLIDFDNEKNNIYYLPILDTVDCISEKSEFNLDKSIIKRVVLKEDRINDRSIFKLGGVSTPYIVVRLDLAESIMRREFKGIKLTRVEMEI